ncbi:MAG: hypothetical protein RL261_819 [Pseudomonadota bacterium]
MAHRERGITLLELVVVGAVIAILAGIAVPAYRGHVLRANRTEGRAALLALATAQEKFYLQCNSYAVTLNPDAETVCDKGNLRFPTSSERGYYDITVSAADANGWAAEAAATGSSPQLDDARCRRFGLTSTGAMNARTAAGTPNDGECWAR